MLQRDFGSTDCRVSVLGLGAGQIGAAEWPESKAGRFLNEALDAGITLIDTARGYGLSEERIGRHLAHRRAEFVLSTKVGYGVPGHQDWTYDGILAGIDYALRLLRTDFLDIVHLHSCPVDVLERGDVIAGLEKARQDGKARVIAYSGDNEPLAWAVDGGKFGSVETSVNLCDQRALAEVLPRACERGLGVIAKRPVANAPWRFEQCPSGHYAEEYWRRWTAMQLDPRGLSWQELAVRFSAYTPGVSSIIIGTTNIRHLLQNVAFVDKGPLPGDHYQAVRDAFLTHDPGWWTGQV